MSGFSKLFQTLIPGVTRIYIKAPGWAPTAGRDDAFGRVPMLSPRLAQNGMSSSMSLLRAPAATARRGAALDGPPDPKSPDDSSDPLPPPLRPSSMVRVELKFCSTT